MSYFDDNEDRIIYGHRRKPNRDTIRGRYNSAPAHNGATGTRHNVQPRGVPAPPGSALARARVVAHAAFDPLWKSGRMTRSQAYVELARRMRVPREQAHIVLFNIEQCERVAALFLMDDFEDLDK